MTLKFKIGAGSLLSAVVAVVAFTDFGRYARHEIAQLRKKADDQVGVKTKIGALKDDVAKVDRKIDAQKNVVAGCRVTFKRAKADQTAAETDVDKLKLELAALHRQITKPGCEPTELKEEFTAKFVRLDEAKARAASAEKAAGTAEEAVRAAEALLQEKIKERDALAREVAELEALHGAVLIREAQNQSRGGDSEGAAIRSHAADIRGHLEVRQERAVMDAPKPAAKPAAKDYDKALKAWKAGE